jgi:RNA polymerase sigma-70 factor (ECF subfamily)
MVSDDAAISGRLGAREFHQLFIENQPRVYAFIRTLLPDFDDAQEVFQSACVIILGKADQFADGTSFTKWACQIAYYEACNYRRRRQKAAPTFAVDVLELLMAEQIERFEKTDLRQDALRNCLGRLRPQDRALLESRYGANKTPSELAAELARPLATVKKTLQRLRRSLQACIERTMALDERSV